MSGAVSERIGLPAVDPLRATALLGVLLLTGSYVWVLYEVADIVGAGDRLLAVVIGALAMATLLAPMIEPRDAGILSGTLLTIGLGWYLLTVPSHAGPLALLGTMIVDSIVLLTGIPVVRITAVETWALGFVPAPVFLSWYLAYHRRYAASAAIGSAALAVFVLTSDANVLTTLVGVGGAAAAVGAGELDAHGATIRHADALAVLVAIMLATSLLVTAIPMGESQPLVPESGTTTQTMESSVVTNDEQISVGGPVELSPQVAFTIRSEREGLWRTGAYDRYTGDGWVRSGESAAYQDGALDPPPGEGRAVTQTVRAERTIGTMPALWKPTEIRGEQAERTDVTSLEGVQPTSPLDEGDQYTVRSVQPDPDADDLHEAGTAYPDDIEEQYTQLPGSTPDRVGDLTDEITADAENPYETSLMVQAWLETEKEYSLSVEEPEDDLADQFIFDMEAGYCTYFATSMVTMLRTQDVPARMVTGYSSGQQVSEDEWVVRGYDSHAWVEVYFPEVGWVTFDPTPAAPRSTAQEDALETARDADADGVDTDETEDLGPEEEWTPTPTETPDTPQDVETSETDGPDVNGAVTGPDASRPEELGERVDSGVLTEGEFEEEGTNLPAPERIGAGIVLLIGLAAGARRTGATTAAYRSVVMRWQRPTDVPEDDVERAFQRLSYLLAREYRERRPGETVPAYLDAIDPLGVDERAYRVAEIRQRGRYGDGVDRASADEAIELVDDIVGERTGVAATLRGWLD